MLGGKRLGSWRDLYETDNLISLITLSHTKLLLTKEYSELIHSTKLQNSRVIPSLKMSFFPGESEGVKFLKHYEESFSERGGGSMTGLC